MPRAIRLVKKFLGFAEDQHILSFLYIGYPDVVPDAAPVPVLKIEPFGWSKKRLPNLGGIFAFCVAACYVMSLKNSRFENCTDFL